MSSANSYTLEESKMYCWEKANQMIIHDEMQVKGKCLQIHVVSICRHHKITFEKKLKRIKYLGLGKKTLNPSKYSLHNVTKKH